MSGYKANVPVKAEWLIRSTNCCPLSLRVIQTGLDYQKNLAKSLKLAGPECPEHRNNGKGLKREGTVLTALTIDLETSRLN